MNVNNWEVPEYKIEEIKEKNSEYCLCIPVINEGKKIINQLKRIKDINIDKEIDIIICDGGSTDGSLELSRLSDLGVKAILTKLGDGKLSAQLRMGYSYALKLGYEGIVTIDGNGKDNVEAVLDFIKELKEGWDFIQGSRYLPGGEAINTPQIRHLAVKLIHIPIISKVSGFKYTDTTNGFRGYSKRFLIDERVRPFRDIFKTYELLAYLSVRAPELNYRVEEIPVIRQYPQKGKIPTKISFVRGNILLLKILYKIIKHEYDPR